MLYVSACVVIENTSYLSYMYFIWLLRKKSNYLGFINKCILLWNVLGCKEINVYCVPDSWHGLLFLNLKMIHAKLLGNTYRIVTCYDWDS